MEPSGGRAVVGRIQSQGISIFLLRLNRISPDKLGIGFTRRKNQDRDLCPALLPSHWKTLRWAAASFLVVNLGRKQIFIICFDGRMEATRARMG